MPCKMALRKQSVAEGTSPVSGLGGPLPRHAGRRGREGDGRGDVVAHVVPDVDEDAVHVEGVQLAQHVGDAVERVRKVLPDRHQLQHSTRRLQLLRVVGRPATRYPSWVGAKFWDFGLRLPLCATSRNLPLLRFIPTNVHLLLGKPPTFLCQRIDGSPH